MCASKTENPGNIKERLADELTVKEAGHLGGLSTLARHGLVHYKEAGRKGQAGLAAKCTSEQRRYWGSLGGRPKKIRILHKGEKKTK